MSHQQGSRSNEHVDEAPPVVQKIARQIIAACGEMKKNRESYGTIIFYIYVVLIAAALISFVFSTAVGLALVGFTVVYSLLALRTVKTDEIGLLTFFGAPVRQVESGLVFVPLPFCELIRESRKDVQLHFGAPLRDDNGNELDLDLYHDGESSEIFMSPSFNITYKADLASAKTDGLAHRITTEPYLVLRYKIEPDPMDSWRYRGLADALRSKDFDPDKDYEPCGFTIFLQRAGSISKANKAIREVAQAEFQQWAGQNTLAYTYGNLGAVNAHLTTQVERSIGVSDTRSSEQTDADMDDDNRSPGKLWWGVNLESCWVSNLGIPIAVRDSLDAAAAAVGKKQAVITRSEGKRQALINEGVGRAAAEQALLIARAKGVRALSRELKEEEGALAFQLIQLENALKDGDNSLNFIGSDVGALVKSILGGRAD